VLASPPEKILNRLYELAEERKKGTMIGVTKTGAAASASFDGDHLSQQAITTLFSILSGVRSFRMISGLCLANVQTQKT
jgi:hypothetical protein